VPGYTTDFFTFRWMVILFAVWIWTWLGCHRFTRALVARFLPGSRSATARRKPASLVGEMWLLGGEGARQRQALGGAARGKDAALFFAPPRRI